MFYCSPENGGKKFYVADGILKLENVEELYGSSP